MRSNVRDKTGAIAIGEASAGIFGIGAVPESNNRIA